MGLANKSQEFNGSAEEEIKFHLLIPILWFSNSILIAFCISCSFAAAPWPSDFYRKKFLTSKYLPFSRFVSCSPIDIILKRRKFQFFFSVYVHCLSLFCKNNLWELLIMTSRGLFSLLNREQLENFFQLLTMSSSRCEEALWWRVRWMPSGPGGEIKNSWIKEFRRLFNQRGFFFCLLFRTAWYLETKLTHLQRRWDEVLQKKNIRRREK